jgi:hypothetical protein
VKDPEAENYKIINFCQIQLAIVQEKENSLRKELLDCKIQKEFLTQTIINLSTENAPKS